MSNREKGVDLDISMEADSWPDDFAKCVADCALSLSLQSLVGCGPDQLDKSVLDSSLRAGTGSGPSLVSMGRFKGELGLDGVRVAHLKSAKSSQIVDVTDLSSRLFPSKSDAPIIRHVHEGMQVKRVASSSLIGSREGRPNFTSCSFPLLKASMIKLNPTKRSNNAHLRRKVSLIVSKGFGNCSKRTLGLGVENSGSVGDLVLNREVAALNAESNQSFGGDQAVFMEEAQEVVCLSKQLVISFRAHESNLTRRVAVLEFKADKGSFSLPNSSRKILPGGVGYSSGEVPCREWVFSPKCYDYYQLEC